MKSRAAVQIGDRRIEIRHIPVPGQLGDDEGLLRVEGNGICGTDWDQYKGALAGFVPYPLITGHEIVGRLEWVGPRAQGRWGLGPGARVAVESTVPCTQCPECMAGRWLQCSSRAIYGLTPLSQEPALSGGNADYLVLRPNSRVYPIPDHLSVEDAVFFNPLGSGFDWGVRLAGTTVGDTVLVLGPGQRGLACVIAAREAGAGCVIAAGRGRKPWKLDLAGTLGATAAINTDQQPLQEEVSRLTNGALVDRLIDTTPASGQFLIDAVSCVRPEGTIVWGAAKEHGDVSPLARLIVGRALTVRGAYSVSEWAKRQAIDALARGRYDLSRVHTHTFALEEADRALRTFGGEVAGVDALHVTIVPN
jgi:threonine dehydrogenase-like Zn-dependent dehydrogenase